MPCCGNAARGARRSVHPYDQRASKRVLFEWRGGGSVTIYGRVTGTRYGFPGPGSRVWVDPRDAPMLEIVQGLELVPDVSP